MNHKIAGTVIIYNCDESVLSNIDTYINFIEKLYVIDNSETPDKELINILLTKYPENKIDYFANNDNLGIASALNMAANKAIKHGFRWLLTMDQDSSFDKASINNLVNSFNHVPYIDRVAIVACNHYNPECSSRKENTHGTNNLYNYYEAMMVITSGNLLNLEAYKDIGLFEEKLFIDCVDHDFCLRAKIKGYKIICFNNILLNHKIGKMQQTSFGLKIKTHSSFRIYYITRNSLYLFSKYFRNYPLLICNRFIRLHGTLLRNILFGTNKATKIINIMKGINHFLINKYGK